MEKLTLEIVVEVLTEEPAVQVCVRVFATAAVSVLHLFLSHHSGTDGLQALHGPTPTLAVWPTLPPPLYTHLHTLRCTHALKLVFILALQSMRVKFLMVDTRFSFLMLLLINKIFCWDSGAGFD